MIFRKKTSNYVSNIDLFLEEFNKHNPMSPEQVAEVKKYQRIDALRDGVPESEEN